MNKIYIIKNNVNNKVYIGKTQFSIEERFKEHCKDYIKRENEKRPLYDAMKKYGVENFFIELIEDGISDEEINDKEIYYIKKYNSYVGFENSKGYNGTLGGDGKKYKNWNIEDIIVLYNKGYSCAKIGEKVGLDRTYIAKILKSNDLPILSGAERSAKELGRPICQIDKDTGEILNIYPTTSQANIALGKKRGNGTINDALRFRRGHNIAYGYKWEYLEK